MQMANHISEQIEYDYDKQMEKCLKSLSKEDRDNVGGEALTQVFMKG